MSTLSPESSKQSLRSLTQLEKLDTRPNRDLDEELARNPSRSCAGRRAASIGPKFRRQENALFTGPPPPIAASAISHHLPSRSSYHARETSQRPWDMVRTIGKSIGQIMFDQTIDRDADCIGRPDPLWRGMRRRERSIETEIQQLLDFQAASLLRGHPVASRSPVQDGSSGPDSSDAGSSTLAGGLRSAAIPMLRSPYIAPYATSDGDLIPLRQPIETKTPGLRSIRAGLAEAMKSLAELRREELDYIDDALKKRESVLYLLDKLSAKSLAIHSEMEALHNGLEASLDKELCELEESYSNVEQQIDELNENLKGLQDQQRRLRIQMQEVTCKRDARLSGYRGALEAVNSDLRILVRQPSILPLDPYLQSMTDNGDWRGLSSTATIRFSSLPRELKSPELAKMKWETEILTLQKRRLQIDHDRIALEEGLVLWTKVITFVSEFETELWHMVRHGVDFSLPKSNNAICQQDLSPSPMDSMDVVFAQLEQALDTAESRGWKLLICSIGAELEAFKEAREVLTELLRQVASAQEKEAELDPLGSQVSTTANVKASPVDEVDDESPEGKVVTHLNKAEPRCSEETP